MTRRTSLPDSAPVGLTWNRRWITWPGIDIEPIIWDDDPDQREFPASPFHAELRVAEPDFGLRIPKEMDFTGESR